MTSVSSSTASLLTAYATSSLDTNGDGVVSAAEEAAGSGRTQDPTVTTDNAATSAASLLAGDMMAMVLALGDKTATDSTTQPASMFDTMDSNSDGKVTQEEFVDARPDDVSEEDATKLYASIDTDNTGAITEEQLQAHEQAHEQAKAPPAFDPQTLAALLGDDDTTTASDSDEALQATLASVIAAYSDTSETDDSTATTDKIIA